jgi:D-hydroxyproline dehydrogenase subunit beta
VTNPTDVIVVGGGIMGLAYAWEAARRGRRVTLLERSDAARGASIRNFGMVWPVGQPAGERHALAMRSRSRWLELRDAGAVWAAECGSVHVVFEEDEARVLAEFADRAPGLGVPCELLAGPEAARRFPTIPADARAVLWSPTELAVNPPRAIAAVAAHLVAAHGVDIRFSTTVVGIDMPAVTTSCGQRFEAPQVVVCGGADFETLFPDLWAASGTRRCKLQMLRTRPQPGGWRLGPHAAGGLTLAHYAGFEICPSLAALKQRLAASMPSHTAAGIHVMASQNEAGEVILGDSHDYDAPLDPFESEAIDDLILGYARRMLRLPDWSIAARWHGVYAKGPDPIHFAAEPQPGCFVMGSPGGAGMTLAFGLAERWWQAAVTTGT